MSPNAGGGGRCGISANEYSCAHGAQINFGDLTPYLTYNICTPFSCYRNRLKINREHQYFSKMVNQNEGAGSKDDAEK
jgi:hypothetical protein